MHHIFADASQLSDNGNILTVTGDDFHHIAHVLRMREGEELSVSLRDTTVSGEMDDGLSCESGRAEYRFGIEEITEDAVVCKLRFVKRDTAELPVRIILLQGLPKGDKMEQIIEKNTELGIAEIVPVALKRCVVKLDEKKAAARVARWNKIAEAAAKQARRGVIPHVAEVMTLAEALAHVEDADLKLIPYELEPADTAENGFPEEVYETVNKEDVEHHKSGSGMHRTRRLVESAAPGQTIAVFIGPEGGFEEQEVQAAQAAGFESVTLGGRILRTETAGMTVTAWFAYRFS